MDSNCHSGWPECDKKEGEWLWIISLGLNKKGYAIPIEYTIKSLEPTMLMLQINPPNSLSNTDKYESNPPLYICPRYEKGQHALEPRSIKVVKIPKHAFFRVPLEIEIKFGINGSLQKDCAVRKVFMSVAIPPDMERDKGDIDKDIDEEDIGSN